MRQGRVGPGVVFWFRNDLRLHDQPALAEAIRQAQDRGGWLLPVYVHDPALFEPTRWGFVRMGHHRQAWLRKTLDHLCEGLERLGSGLLESSGDPGRVLVDLVLGLGAAPGVSLVCEDIAAPEETAAVAQLRARGLEVTTVWQSTLIAPESLPFAPEAVPETFTVFRKALEAAGAAAAPARAAPTHLPSWPAGVPKPRPGNSQALGVPAPQGPADARSAFPAGQPGFEAGEGAALGHLGRYCTRALPHTYKATRNGLLGTDFSSKCSPWLATGALSARAFWAAIAAFEREHGANEGTYWLWFELLWRDHFRWLHRKHGSRLYRGRGLTDHPAPRHNPEAFARWCQARTGCDFVDAGLTELHATGYLSNRMRQNVASYLIHELGGDWRAGAAWFESQLLDYDVYSNQGNWLYLSGRGTDPRPGRRFNPDKQAHEYDTDGAYRRVWLSGREGQASPA